MKRHLAATVAFTSGTLLAVMGSGALAQSSDDMRKQIEDLQRQLQILKDRLDKQEDAAAQARRAAPATPAQPSSQAPAQAPAAGYSGSGLQVRTSDEPSAWRGWYAGASFGLGSMKTTWTDTSCLVFCADVTSYSGAKAVGSVRGGYNWIQDRLLLGVEADFNSGVHQEESNAGSLFLLGPGGTSARATSKINWYTTLRARAGVFASPDTLLYMTGGPAYGKQTTNYTLSGLGPPFGNLSTDSGSSRKWGYTVGAGLEHRFNATMSFTLEYAYLTLRHNSQDFAIPLAPIPAFTDKTNNSLQTGRIGLNWRF